MGNSKDFRTEICDVWAESRKLRGIIFRSLVLKAARRLRPPLMAAFLPPPLLIKNAPLAAIAAVFVLMHVFAGVMLIHATVAVVSSAQSDARPSVASNRTDDLGDQAVIHNGAQK